MAGSLSGVNGRLPTARLVTVAKDAPGYQRRQGDRVELHLGRGSTHQYDPRYPERYNVTTFGENDLAVDISGSAASSRNSSLTVSEKPVSALLADKGPDWRDARVEFQNRIAFPVACIVFALLGVPIGVRPRRGGRAAGLILTLVLIGGYYFLWIAGRSLGEAGKAFRRGRESGRLISLRRPWESTCSGGLKQCASRMRCLRGSRLTGCASGEKPDTRLSPPRRHRMVRWRPRFWWRRMARSQTALFPKKRHQRGRCARRRIISAASFPMMFDIYILRQFVLLFSACCSQGSC